MLVLVLVPACAGVVTPPSDDNTSAALGSVGGAADAATTSSRRPPAAAGAHLTYYGGPVISNVRVHDVFWGAGVQFQSQLDAFFTAITNSPYFDWLDEYATPTQHIGRGSFGGSLVDSARPPATTSPISRSKRSWRASSTPASSARRRRTILHGLLPAGRDHHDG